MRTILLLMNGFLCFASATLTMFLLHLFQDTKEIKSQDFSSAPLGLSKGEQKKKSTTSSRKNLLRKQDLNGLWENNLFHPDRVYEDEIYLISVDEVKEHFELVSIAQVGPISCASIRVLKGIKKKKPRRSVKRRSNRRSTRNSRASSRRSQKDKRNQKIYRLGDIVGETRFELAEIGIDYIILKKGEQELRLTLDKEDEASTKRREVAFKKEEKKSALRKKKREEDANKEESKKAPKVPPPPPPPPLPAALSNLPPGSGSNAEPENMEPRQGNQQEQTEPPSSGSNAEAEPDEINPLENSRSRRNRR